MSGLEFANVSVQRGTKQLLAEVSLEVEAGQLLALLGPNGAGKTTLLRVALGLVQPTSGEVRVAKRPLHELPGKERAATLGWLPQHASAAEPVRVVEAVAAARFRFEESKRSSEQAARSALERVGLSTFAEARITQLSGGERQRVALAALIAQQTRIALLDEPGNHLDPARQIEIYRLLGALWREGLGVVLVTHDVNLLMHLGAPERVRVLGLSNGRAQFETRYDSPQLAPRLSELFGLTFVELHNGSQRVLLPNATTARAPV